MFGFLQDRDFSDPRRLYLNRESGDLVEVYEDRFGGEFVTEKENQAARLRVTEAATQFLEIPIPDHGQHHVWFKDFLDTTGREGYFGSIGGWLKVYGSEEDKYEWQEFRDCRLADCFVDCCERNGLSVTLK